jgi:His/Glu/Gln/Arg/opine family amino acid ABC transporter permease subunit
MHYQWDFYFLQRYVPLLERGVMVTLGYTAATIFIGLVIGLAVGLGRLSKSWLVNLPLVAFIEAFRCTPLLVQIVWFYYALPVILGIQIPATLAGIMTLSCYTGAFYAEIFRGGIISIEQGQWDAARARAAALAGDAQGDPAPGDPADDPAVRQPVDHPAEEHLAGIDHRSAGPAVQRHADNSGHLPAAGGLYRGCHHLLRPAVPKHAAGTGLRA